MECPKIKFDTTEEFFVDEIAENDFDFSVTAMPKRYWGADFSQYPTPFAESLKNFSLENTDKTFMVLEGGNGTGKTYNGCSCIGHRVKNGLRAGFYISSKYTVCPMMRSSKLTTGKKNEIDTLSFFYQVPFLFLDEVGKGDDGNLEKTFISSVLSARYDNVLKTIIATNMTMNELCKWLGEDINSRFYQCAEVLTINECDYRKK